MQNFNKEKFWTLCWFLFPVMANTAQLLREFYLSEVVPRVYKEKGIENTFQHLQRSANTLQLLKERHLGKFRLFRHQ